jgi:hypothetical protein
MSAVCAGQPSVEIGVLLDRLAAFAAHGDFLLRNGRVTVRAVERGDAMTPPQLPGDAPVQDVLEPVLVRRHPEIGDERHLARAHRLEGAVGEPPHRAEPLHGQVRFDHRVAALAVADGVTVRLLATPHSLLHQRREHGLAGLEAVHPRERSAVGVDLAVLGEDVDTLEAMPLARRQVVRVMGGGHLDRAGSELGVHEHGVGDHGERAVEKRVADQLADQRPVPRVVRMDGHRRIAEHGLRAARRDDDLATFDERIREIPHPAVDLLVDDLEVGERRQTARAPVDEPVRPVDQPFAVQRDEGVTNGVREHLVEREPLARPVARGTQRLRLLRDVVLVLRLPLPHPFEERFPPELLAARPLLRQLSFHHDLRGDPRVVGTGQPQRVEPLHAPPADDEVLEGELQRVTDVQLAGHVRGWYEDNKRLLRGRNLGRERPGRFPGTVPPGLERGRVESSRQLVRTPHAPLREPYGIAV